MSKPLERRMDKLEQSITPSHERVRVVFCEVGESVEEARVRFNVEHPDDLLLEDDFVITVCWKKS